MYLLPRHTTFRFRYALYLIEARNRIAYVRGIFQRLLALLRKCELGCGYPITSWLGQLCHYFSRSGTPCPWAVPGSFSRLATAAFRFLPRGMVDVFFARGFGHARLIHFFFDASECRLAGFLLWLVLMHTCTMSRVQRDYRSIWNRTGSFSIVSIPSSLEQSLPIPQRSPKTGH